MLPGTTIATGAPTTCPGCGTFVLPLQVLSSPAGAYIGTRCRCGPAYTRESGYYATEAAAEQALAARTFGRDGIDAAAVAAYWHGTASTATTEAVPVERDDVVRSRGSIRNLAGRIPKHGPCPCCPGGEHIRAYDGEEWDPGRGAMERASARE